MFMVRSILPYSPLQNIGSEYRDLDEAMQVYYRQLERPAPRKRNIQSVARWLEGNKPLTVSESSFMNDWNDLVAPADQLDHGSLDAAIASIGDLLYRWRLPMVLLSRALSEGMDQELIFGHSFSPALSASSPDLPKE